MWFCLRRRTTVCQAFPWGGWRPVGVEWEEDSAGPQETSWAVLNWESDYPLPAHFISLPCQFTSPLWDAEGECETSWDRKGTGPGKGELCPLGRIRMSLPKERRPSPLWLTDEVQRQQTVTLNFAILFPSGLTRYAEELAELGGINYFVLFWKLDPVYNFKSRVTTKTSFPWVLLLFLPHPP